MTTTMARHRRSVRSIPVLLGAVVVGITGCSSDVAAPDDSAPDADVAAEVDAESGVDTDDDSGDVPASEGAGRITVGTTTYSVLEAVNCEPVQSTDVVTEVFSAIATGQSDSGDSVLFFAYTHEQNGVAANFVDYQGPEGTFSTREGTATFTVNGGTLSGAGAVVDDANTESLMVQFEFDIPEELVEC